MIVAVYRRGTGPGLLARGIEHATGVPSAAGEAVVAISVGESPRITSELSDSSRKCRHEYRADGSDAGQNPPANI
jgi:hypothetical protein